MANIDTYLEQIANGEYGRDVRDAIHDALEAINDSIPNSTSVSQEVISARTPGDQGLPPYNSLKERLDTESEGLLEQAEQLATPGIRANIQITNATVGYSSLKDRLDTEYADLNRKVGRVIGRAEAAATAAEEAVTAATQAQTSAESAATTASTKATEAANAASTAATKATEASSAAANALSNAQSASGYASNASISASNAAFSANEAVTAAQQAQQAAQSLVVDATLTQQGKPADAKKVGDELTDLKGDLNGVWGNIAQAQRQVIFQVDCSTINQDNIATTQTGILLPGHTYRIYPYTKTWEMPNVSSGTSMFWIQAGNVTPSQWNWFSPFLYIIRYPTVTLDDYIDITIPKGSNLVQIALRAKATAGILQFRYEDIGVYSISKYFGKLSIIGDSIDTFNKDGYKIDGYAMYYPSQYVPDIVSVEQTWWKKVINASNMTLEVNASYSGSRVTNTDANKPDFYARVGLIGSPDVIFVTLGTNDSGANVALGEFDFDTPYSNLSESTFRTAYIKGIKALKNAHPNARIVCICERMLQRYKDSISHIADVLGVTYIDASDYIGENGVHPGIIGMEQIASSVLYPTDKSLTQNYIPADSRAVGDKISSTKESIINNVVGNIGFNIATYTDGIHIHNGVTYNANSIRNTIIANGVVGNQPNSKLNLFNYTPSRTGVYYISGCPSGGGETTHWLGIWSNIEEYKETGEGLFAVLKEGVTYSIYIQYNYTQSANNEVFQPVIMDVTYLNYATFTDGTTVKNGITYTSDFSENTIIANGTSINPNSQLQLTAFVVPETGIYYIGGRPKGNSDAMYWLGLWSNSKQFEDRGNGVLAALNEGEAYTIYVHFNPGITANNLVFKPIVINTNVVHGLSLRELEKSLLSLETIYRKSKTGAINILDIGGKNDGTVDIGSIINTYTPYYDIYLPCGRYLVNTPIVLHNSLLGENSTRSYIDSVPNTITTTLISSLSSGTLITLGSTGYKSITIKNINIKCNGDENAISLGDSYILCKLEDISINNLGNAIGVIRTSPGSRNLYANNISIFAKEFKESTGIKMQTGNDDRLSNIEIMFCQVGLNVSGFGFWSNVHVWSGSNHHDDQTITHNWFVNTVGLLSTGEFFGCNIYLDTCYNYIYSKSALIHITNLKTWDDNGASYYENEIYLVKKEGTGNLKLSGTYKADRINLDSLTTEEKTNLVPVPWT